jgi:hypothetical protein
MSQGDLAAKLGVAQSYVSRVESGMENLTLSTCERFASAVGCVYSSALIFNFGTVGLKHRGIGNVTLSTCERFAQALGAIYSSALNGFHGNFTKK